MIECTYAAVYSDGKSYDVEWNDLDGGTYLVATNGALIPVPFFLSDGSHFIEYKCVGIAGLTEGSFWEQDSLMRKRLRAPVPTAPPPVVEAENDESFVPKFHCPRLPNENSFAYLQRANAQKIEWERTQRAQARRQHMTESNTPDARKLAEAQTARAQALSDRKPRGGGGGFEVKRES
jgi:hypothetical protein